jgi:predicted ATPase
LGDTPQLFPVLWGLARMHDVRGELRVGRELGGQLLTLAQRVQDPALLLEAHHELWANLSALGELTSARAHAEQGFALYDPEQHKHHAFLYGGHDPGVCCGYHAAEVLWLLGYPDQALRRSRDALTLARSLSHPATMANVLFFSAWFHHHRGDWQIVQARVDEGMTLATERGFSRWLAQATFLQGWLSVQRGEKEGVAQMVEALATERAGIGVPRWTALFVTLLAEAHGKTGQTGEGLNVVNEELANARVAECCCYEPELHRVKGDLLLAQAESNEEESERCYQNSLKIALKQSAKSLELRAAMSMSRLWQKQGKIEEARNLLGEVYSWFTEGFDMADLKEAKLLLERLA